MQRSKTYRDKLFHALREKIESADKLAITTLYHHIYSMKLGDDYIFNTENELEGIIAYLNANY